MAQISQPQNGYLRRFSVCASIAPNADVILEHVGINPTRIGVINILRAMGGDLTLLNAREVGGEPVADIRVRSAKLIAKTAEHTLAMVAGWSWLSDHGLAFCP